MKNIQAKLTIIALCLLCTSSCATLFNGPDQTIPIATNPPGATVTTENTSALTPAKLTLERNRDYMLTITKEGYKTETVKVKHVISGAAAGNIFGISFLGYAIDTASGALWDLKPDNIIVTLRPLSPHELVDEANRLNEQSLKTQLKTLDNLKKARLLTENQYLVFRDLTLHCLIQNIQNCPEEQA